MLSANFTRASLVLTCFTVAVLSAACTGSSSSGKPSPDSDAAETELHNDQTQIGNGIAGNAVVILPSTETQPNTVSQSLIADANGRIHATYADIDGRVFYATCEFQCQRTSSWSGIELTRFEVESVTGGVTPKILLDNNQNPRIAVSHDRGNFGILSEHQLHYLSCDNVCGDPGSWTTGRAVTLQSAPTPELMAKNAWFALTPAGQPRFAYIQSAPDSTDAFLFYFACDNDCHDAANWSTTPVQALRIASNQPVNVVIDRAGGVHILAGYRIVGSSDRTLLYFSCVDSCISAAQWFAPAELLKISDSSFARDDMGIALLNSQSPVIAVFDSVDSIADDQPAVYLLTCNSDCASTDSWSRSEVLSELSLSESIELSESSITLSVDNGLLQLGMVGRDLQSDVQNRVFKLSCTEPCTDNAWSYHSLADSNSLNFNIDGCLFLGADANGPISLLPGGVGIGLRPEFGCEAPRRDVRFLKYAVYVQ